MNRLAHPGETWVRLRAERLGLEIAAAQQRDASFAERPQEDGLWWDPELAGEVWGIWARVCTDCHEGQRSRQKVQNLPPPPRHWADTPARFFARERLPAEVFAIIRDGVDTQGEHDMPAWAAHLSNEQIWGLVYFVRAASQGKQR